MKKLIAIILCICLLLLTACQSDENGKTETNSQPSQTVDDMQTEIDFIQETLMSYLNDCWGYRKGIHKFEFDTTIELNGIDYYVFKVYLADGEYSNSFAISLDEKKVYLLTNEGWVEDKNPEPWSKW